MPYHNNQRMRFTPKKPVGKCYPASGMIDLSTATDAQLEQLHSTNPALIESLFIISAKPAKNGKATKEPTDTAAGHEANDLNAQGDDGHKVGD